MAGIKIGMVSLGCAKNLVDSEIMLGLLKEAGFEVTNDAEQADAIIVNTCSFIGPAKEESVDTILEMAEYKAAGKCRALVVTGCLSQRYGEELMRELPEVDGVVGTGEFHQIVEVINQVLEGERTSRVGRADISYEKELPRVVSTGQHSAYVKIAEGCDHRCAFCVIPSLRGRYRSRSFESIEREVRRLVASGTKEVNLIAQDTSAYGLDLYGKPRLAELLSRLADIEGLSWIRVLYTYPYNLTDELIEVMAREPKVCKYIDMPLQHSDDDILRRMRRPGNRARMEELIAKIRQRIPGVAVRSSFIVGFPGETEKAFEDLYDFLAEVRFDHVGVFPYSAEEGTPACEMPDQIDEETKLLRRERLMKLQESISLEKNKLRVGSVYPVLIEGPSEESELVIQGRTQFQAPEVDGVVYVGDLSLSPGQIVPVRITQAYAYDLVGEIEVDKE